MRALIGMGVLLVSLSAAVAEEPRGVLPPVGQPMRIVPVIIGQPMTPRSPNETHIAAGGNAPRLLIAPPPETPVPAAPPLQIAETSH